MDASILTAKLFRRLAIGECSVFLAAASTGADPLKISWPCQSCNFFKKISHENNGSKTRKAWTMKASFVAKAHVTRFISVDMLSACISRDSPSPPRPSPDLCYKQIPTPTSSRGKEQRTVLIVIVISTHTALRCFRGAHVALPGSV